MTADVTHKDVVLDQQEVMHALEANMQAYWLSLGRGEHGMVYDGDDLKWAYTGRPVMNRVVDASLDEQDVATRVGSVRRQFSAWKASFAWLVGPSTRPADLGLQLAAQGFAYEGSWLGMALDLSRLNGDTGDRHGLIIREVAGETALQQWIDMLGRAFDLPSAAEQVFRDAFRARRHRGASNGPSGPGDHPWRHYVGLLDGRPVSTATLVEAAGVAGVYLVATVPEMRRRGFGTVLTRHVLVTARAHGYHLAVLQATGSGEVLYRKMGFEECCRIGVFRWTPLQWRHRLRRLARSLGAQYLPGVARSVMTKR